MKRQARGIQYTVRGAPEDVDRALRMLAAKRKLSLNQVILAELATATTGLRKRADFSDLVGRWTDDPAFDGVIASQRQIDVDRWN